MMKMSGFDKNIQCDEIYNYFDKFQPIREFIQKSTIN